MMNNVRNLRRYLPVDDQTAEIIERVGARYPWKITEYYASLMDPGDPSCPIRRQAVPAADELDPAFGEDDPLLEDAHMPVPGVIRVYPDRVAVIVTGRCPMYCRFCLRKRLCRDGADDLKGARLNAVVRYVRNDPSIRDVLLTGGDPLVLPDGELDTMLEAFAGIGHVELLRIGTRALCTWPERVTPALADLLAAHHPVWVNTQFNHPRELTDAASRAIATLVDRGIPVGNQSVLLAGVNDSLPVLQSLMRELVRRRVRPYYLYQAQHLSGTGHFVVPIERGIELTRGLRGRTTGFAIPQYVLDTPYGKIPLNPDYCHGRSGDYVELESFDGRCWREYNPLDRGRPGTAAAEASDHDLQY